MTDEARHYAKLGDEFATHDTVTTPQANTSRGPRPARRSTPTRLRATYSIFKRGMKGVYQHCGEKHLHRYLAEFDFRYNNRVALGVNDAERAETSTGGRGGKRLTYQTANSPRV